jgi:hypothetical protein
MPCLLVPGVYKWVNIERSNHVPVYAFWSVSCEIDTATRANTAVGTMIAIRSRPHCNVNIKYFDVWAEAASHKDEGLWDAW